MFAARSLLLLAMLWIATCSLGVRAAVSLGIDELEESKFAILRGQRVGLVTNPSGADSRGRSAIAVLYGGTGNGFHLVKLFGPEHGIDGKTGAGLDVRNSRDRLTGLPVYSLFGDTRRPTPAMLQGLDTIVFDVQDLGNRSYTFISTLGYVMQAAAEHGIAVVVLDRPNPLGGLRIEGPRLDGKISSFVGLYNIPLVYGLTPGELAQWINAKYLTRPCRLSVVPMRGWTRSMVWEDTGLKWVPTSPNIPTVGAMRGYSATGFLGEIGIETGIGSKYPFQIISGTGWDTHLLAARFNALQIPGVRALPYNYRVGDGKWSGSAYTGIYLQMDPRNSGNLTSISFEAVALLQRYVRGFDSFDRTTGSQRDMFDKIAGNTICRRVLSHNDSVDDLVDSWNRGVDDWARERLPYLLYGNSKSEAAGPAMASDAAAAATAPR